MRQAARISNPAQPLVQWDLKGTNIDATHTHTHTHTLLLLLYLFGCLSVCPDPKRQFAPLLLTLLSDCPKFVRTHKNALRQITMFSTFCVGALSCRYESFHSAVDQTTSTWRDYCTLSICGRDTRGAGNGQLHQLNVCLSNVGTRSRTSGTNHLACHYVIISQIPCYLMYLWWHYLRVELFLALSIARKLSVTDLRCCEQYASARVHPHHTTFDIVFSVGQSTEDHWLQSDGQHELNSKSKSRRQAEHKYGKPHPYMTCFVYSTKGGKQKFDHSHLIDSTDLSSDQLHYFHRIVSMDRHFMCHIGITEAFTLIEKLPSIKKIMKFRCNSELES